MSMAFCFSCCKHKNSDCMLKYGKNKLVCPSCYTRITSPTAATRRKSKTNEKTKELIKNPDSYAKGATIGVYDT